MVVLQRTRLVTRYSSSMHNKVLFALLILLILLGVEWNLVWSSDTLSVTYEKNDDKRALKSANSVHKDYELAYNQSLGYFFNSITNKEWKMRQQWAQWVIQQRYVNDIEKYWKTADMWYFYHFEPSFSCPFQKRVRGEGDGPKWTCDPHQLKRLAQEQSCLIYSIGSNGDYQWEDGMYIETDGLCEVHVFDYSKDYKRPEDSERNIHFHQWGLQSSQEPQKGRKWKTLPQMIKELGHENRTINVFKIDCEGCEWSTFQDWVSLDIRQILIETHYLPENRTHGLEFFDSFAKNNFVMFSKESNPWAGGKCFEFSYVKMHPDFLGGNTSITEPL